MRQLRKAKVETISARTCQAKYTDFVKNPEIVVISEDMFCAGNQKADACAGKLYIKALQEKSSCISGDSGGPLLYNARWTKFRWTVYGVVSFGPKICADTKLPGVFTKVDRYLHWIQTNTQL